METLKKALTEDLIKELLGALRTTADFTMEQVPGVVKEILVWNAVEAILMVLVALGFMALAYLAWEAATKIAVDAGGWPATDETCFLLVAMTVLLGVGSTMFVNFWLIPIKICLAPRLYLIEYLSGLVK